MTTTERRCGTCKWLHPDRHPEYEGRRMCIYPIVNMPDSVSSFGRVLMAQSILAEKVTND